ncbi:hypothetical protein OG936_20400 [Streptomyces sp. NBC_00846]|uniref:hypothetical protein n=1 Tax=Streptomyces sp. NBC_00846 TaxID=2975849 RepID=UPI0038644F95|nr:hypothetical protein OG936_20400 [Streptomyces sp. NBC_00846]
MPTPTPLQPVLEHGYRFEALRYGPATRFVPEPIDLRIMATPQEAIRAIRGRGESCGFTLSLRGGRHIEWHVRPVTYVSLDTHAHQRLRTAAPRRTEIRMS